MSFLDNCATSSGMLGAETKASAAWPYATSRWERGRPMPAPEEWEGHAKAFENISTIQSCVNRIATDIASCPFRIYKKPTTKKGQREDVTDAPGFKVFRDPNEWQTTIDFWRQSIAHLKLFGMLYWELVRGNNDKRLAYLYTINPQWMRPLKDPQTFVSGYELNPGKGRSHRFNTDEVMWLHCPHPLDDYKGLTPLSALRTETMLFSDAEKWAARTFRNDVRPSVIVTHKDTLTDARAQEYRTRFTDRHAGVDNAYKALLLDGDVTAQIVSSSLKDMEYTGLLTWTKQQILSAFGTPPAALGIFEGPYAIRANTEEQLRWYWQTTVASDQRLLARATTEYLLWPLWGTSFEAEFDSSKVEVLQEAEEAHHARLKDMFEHGVVTPNQWREETGRDRVDSPAMDAYYIVANLYEIASNDPERQARARARAEAEAATPEPDERVPAEPTEE